MINSLRRVASAFRRPRSRRTLPHPSWDSDTAVICLAAAQTPAEAARSVLKLAGIHDQTPTLVVPSMATRPGRGAHPHFVASLLDTLEATTDIGVPPSTPASVRRRWEQLAAQYGAGSVRLGSAGWDRVELAREAFFLDEVYLPSELHAYPRVIAVPALADEALALGFLREIAHPHTRMRARGTSRRNRLDAEIASAAKLAFVIDGSRLPGVVATNIAVWAPDPLSAELAGAGLRRFIDAARGYESVSAWEHERVQAATELAIGPATGAAMLIRAEEANRAVRPVAEYLANELSCRITWVAEEGFNA
jgi:hypothetical protein